MADEPVSPGWHFSENDLKFATELGRWILAAIAFLTLWVQQHNQQIERIEVQKQAITENNERLDKIASEVKASGRLVYGEKK